MEDGKAMINVIYEDNHILVVEKPINIPTQEDSSKDKDLLNLLKEYLKEKYNKPFNVYLGLIHRLDRPVGGIMVFARTSKAASRLSEQLREKRFKKIYYAVVEGKIDDKSTLSDKLLKDPNTNIVKVDSRGKEAILYYERIDQVNDMSLIKIELETGRSHQIRVQLSNHGFPLYGDQKYNINSKVGQQLALFSQSISFFHPTTNELLTFSLELPKKDPWKIFNIK